MACECAICKNNKPFAFPKEIIDAALDGELVLFCGAGISTESKNVLPYSFYTSIKNELDVKDESVSFSDLMQLYCNQPNGRKKLLKRIRERFNYISSFPELERQAIYMDELKRVSHGRSKFQKQAKEIVKAKAGNGLIVHHPPY